MRKASERWWTHENAWCNTDFEILHAVLTHFRQDYAKSPETTSGTFVVPVWLDKKFWRKLKGSKLVALYSKGSQIFTAPPAGPLTRKVKPRRDLGPTRWLTAVVHFPALGRRYTGGSTGEEARGREEAGGPASRHSFVGALPTLSGDSVIDFDLLRSVRPTQLPAMPRCAVHPDGAGSVPQMPTSDQNRSWTGVWVDGQPPPQVMVQIACEPSCFQALEEEC